MRVLARIERVHLQAAPTACVVWAETIAETPLWFKVSTFNRWKAALCQRAIDLNLPAWLTYHDRHFGFLSLDDVELAEDRAAFLEMEQRRLV